MAKEINVLAVTPEYPYPPIDGHKVRVYNLLKNLPPEVRVDLITFGEVQDHPRGDELRSQWGPSLKRVELISKGTLEPMRLRGPMASIRNIFFPYETTIGPPYFSQSMAVRVGDLARTGKYDLIHLCGLYSSLYCRRKPGAIPYVIDICDCLSLLAKSDFEQERRPNIKIRKFIHYIWADRYEKIHVSGNKNLIMISSVDAQRISRNCPNSRIWVVPNGVDTEYFKRREASISNIGEMLFTGVMDYPPNNAAMFFFIKEVFPLVRNNIPEATIVIAGRNPTEELRSLAAQTSGVRVTGFVDDLRPYFEAASVYVSPLLSGAGVKNKVLEAWSMEMPVVATAISCNGILARDNENILIADTPETFTKKIVSALYDEKLRKRLSRGGRKTVEGDYSWSNQGMLLSSIYREILMKTC